MAKELNEDTSVQISIKTLAGIAFAMAAIISGWFVLQADIAEAKKLQAQRIENIILGVLVVFFLGAVGAVLYLVLSVD